MITTALSTIQKVGNGVLESFSSRTETTRADAAAGVARSFGDALGDVATTAVGSLHDAERLSIAALQGKADTREVVDAVMSAEQSLQAAIAIRDKIVSAYLEISRMQI